MFVETLSWKVSVDFRDNGNFIGEMYSWTCRIWEKFFVFVKNISKSLKV